MLIINARRYLPTNCSRHLYPYLFPFSGYKYLSCLDKVVYSGDSNGGERLGRRSTLSREALDLVSGGARPCLGPFPFLTGTLVLSSRIWTNAASALLSIALARLPFDMKARREVERSS
jgi:hypothetical protein